MPHIAFGEVVAEKEGTYIGQAVIKRVERLQHLHEGFPLNLLVRSETGLVDGTVNPIVQPGIERVYLAAKSGGYRWWLYPESCPKGSFENLHAQRMGDSMGRTAASNSIAGRQLRAVGGLGSAPL